MQRGLWSNGGLTMAGCGVQLKGYTKEGRLAQIPRLVADIKNEVCHGLLSRPVMTRVVEHTFHSTSL